MLHILVLSFITQQQVFLFTHETYKYPSRFVGIFIFPKNIYSCIDSLFVSNLTCFPITLILTWLNLHLNLISANPGLGFVLDWTLADLTIALMFSTASTLQWSKANLSLLLNSNCHDRFYILYLTQVYKF